MLLVKSVPFLYSMYLVQILLPLYDNRKRAFARSSFDEVRSELTEKFGGVTAFVRSPAEGLWKQSKSKVSRDDLVMFEVLTDSLSRTWWTKYRKSLEKRFKQDEVVMLAMKVEKM